MTKFKFYENDRKFSKWVENTARIGEITRYEQFLLFPQCFQKMYTVDTYKPGLVWKRVKKVVKMQDSLTHSHTMTPFDAPGKQAF